MKRRIPLEKGVQFVFRHRHLIADGCMLAALLLKNWPITTDFTLPEIPPPRRRACAKRIK